MSGYGPIQHFHNDPRRDEVRAMRGRDFPRNGGEIARLIRGKDWSRSPLGSPSQWSQNLRSTVEMLLAAHAQIVLFWGHDFVALYNDTYAPSIGDKHPRALGRPAVENWGELWDDLEPLLSGVRDTGKTFSAKDRPFYIERHGYGETSYFDVSYSAVLEDDGSVGGVLCIVSETTERKQHEERQKILLDELNHRVKNTLTTVQSMAAQSLRNASGLADAQTSFEARLIALSKTHDVLTTTHWEGADLHMLVTRAVSPYAERTHLARFEIDGPTLYLAPKSALALSMALHELATNAVKYGALSTEGGRVSITWDFFPAAGPTHLRLKWTERDGPPVQPPKRRGFGSRLIERGLARDIDGDVHLSFATDGLVCTIEAPLQGMQGDS